MYLSVTPGQFVMTVAGGDQYHHPAHHSLGQRGRWGPDGGLWKCWGQEDRSATFLFVRDSGSRQMDHCSGLSCGTRVRHSSGLSRPSIPQASSLAKSVSGLYLNKLISLQNKSIIVTPRLYRWGTKVASSKSPMSAGASALSMPVTVI